VCVCKFTRGASKLAHSYPMLRLVVHQEHCFNFQLVAPLASNSCITGDCASLSTLASAIGDCVGELAGGFVLESAGEVAGAMVGDGDIALGDNDGDSEGELC